MDDDKWEVTSPQFNEGIQHLAVAPKNSQKKHQDWLWYRYTSFLATGKFPWKLHLEPDTTAVPTNPPTRTRCGTHTWTLDVNGVGLLHFDDLVTTGAAFLGSPKQTPKEKKTGIQNFWKNTRFMTCNNCNMEILGGVFHNHFLLVCFSMRFLQPKTQVAGMSGTDDEFFSGNFNPFSTPHQWFNAQSWESQNVKTVKTV